MLRAILNKSWRQHPTRHQQYGHLPPITKTIQVRRARHAGHYWRRRDELISDVLLWTPTHGRAKAGRPARTYIQQLCEDTGCCPEDLPWRSGEGGSGISVLPARYDDDDLWERYGPYYPSSYSLISITTVFSRNISLAFNTSQGLICHETNRLHQILSNYS